MKSTNRPLVIFLNGPSSSGKTSLARILQEELKPDPFLHIGIDSLIAMMPEWLNNWEGDAVDEGFCWQVSENDSGQKVAKIQAGPYAHKISQSLKSVVVTLLEDGHNVIVDEVCVFPGSFADWQHTLAPFKTLYVGLTAPIEILEARERARNDRMHGSARAQSTTVHAGNQYHLMLDTGVQSLKFCADAITSKKDNT